MNRVKFNNPVTCPCCGGELLGADKICRIDKQPPKTGDLAICNYCTELCIMEVQGDEISVRELTYEDIARLKSQFPNFDKQIEAAKTVIDNSKID
ncbi:MAG TPA: hypothetical protein VFV08_07665, partial [Puia sp.]|nr:hypothetical protein [Puia sp.]